MSNIVPLNGREPDKNDNATEVAPLKETAEMLSIWQRLDAFQRIKLLEIARKLRVFSNTPTED